MSDEREQVALWLSGEAVRQRELIIEQLEKRLNELKCMGAIQFTREEGLKDICPSNVPKVVLGWLGIGIKTAHFNVRGDPGNVGLRLEVYQDSCEWDNIPDPWRAP